MKKIVNPSNRVAQKLHRSYQVAPFLAERENLASAIEEIERLHMICSKESHVLVDVNTLEQIKNLLVEFGTNCLAGSNRECVSRAKQLATSLEQLLPSRADTRE
jgi:hypothetical protein